jgi:hypothetical protein
LSETRRGPSRLFRIKIQYKKKKPDWIVFCWHRLAVECGTVVPGRLTALRAGRPEKALDNAGGRSLR